MFLNYIEEYHFQNEQIFNKEALTSTFSVLMLKNILLQCFKNIY